MTEEKKQNSIPPGMKLGRKWGYVIVGILAVVIPAWTGAVNSWNSGDGVVQARGHALKAEEKAALGYELLSQKVESLEQRLERHENRMDKIDEKLDRLLIRSSRNGRGSRETEEKIKAMASAEPVEPEPEQMILPKDLDLAYKTRKAAAAEAGL